MFSDQGRRLPERGARPRPSQDVRLHVGVPCGPVPGRMKKSLFLKASIVAVRIQVALYVGMAAWCVLDGLLH